MTETQRTFRGAIIWTTDLFQIRHPKIQNQTLLFNTILEGLGKVTKLKKKKSKGHKLEEIISSLFVYDMILRERKPKDS